MLDEWGQTHATLTPPAADQAWGEQPAGGLCYQTLEQFVCEFLLETYRRPISGTATTWCPEWWRHPEAIHRLNALWRTFEHLRLDPCTGMSVWWRDHADPHMTVLLSADGPFKGCTEQRHAERPLRPLRSTPAPEGFWVDRRDL